MTHIVMTALPAPGHINPAAPLLGDLVGRGIDVTVCATEEFRPVVESLGAEFRPYPDSTISSTVIADATRRGGPTLVVQRLLEATRTILPDLQDAWRTDPPDAIMFDSNALWGRMLATSLGRPAISLMTTMLVGTSAFRALGVREAWPVLRDSVTAVPGILSARRRLLRVVESGLLPSSPIFPTRGELTIFPIPQWMQPPDERLDASCLFVGPSIDPGTRDTEPDDDLDTVLRAEDPLVVVSLGTLHAGGEEFFRSCIDALEVLPANVLLVIGGATDPATLPATSPNIVVRSAVPQLEALRSASVFVTHGGMNSVLESLHFGVPMVVVPQQLEQLLIGRTIADRGAGELLRHHLGGRAISTGELRATVEALLENPSYTVSARDLARGLHDGGGAREAADRIVRLLEERSSS